MKYVILELKRCDYGTFSKNVYCMFLPVVLWPHCPLSCPGRLQPPPGLSIQRLRCHLAVLTPPTPTDRKRLKMTLKMFEIFFFFCYFNNVYFLPFHQVDLFLQAAQVVPCLLWHLVDQRSPLFQSRLSDPDSKSELMSVNVAAHHIKTIGSPCEGHYFV